MSELRACYPINKSKLPDQIYIVDPDTFLEDIVALLVVDYQDIFTESRSTFKRMFFFHKNICIFSLFYFFFISESSKYSFGRLTLIKPAYCSKPILPGRGAWPIDMITLFRDNFQTVWISQIIVEALEHNVLKLEVVSSFVLFSDLPWKKYKMGFKVPPSREIRVNYALMVSCVIFVQVIPLVPSLSLHFKTWWFAQ